MVCILALLLTVSVTAPACGDAPVPGERVLLLRTGRVVQGRLRQISTGWLVSAKHGHVVIPFDQVRMDADDVEEVYLSLRLQLLRNPTVASHLNLADWCLSQKLLREASLEVRSAMQIDPANETARLMLKRLETHVARAVASFEQQEAPVQADVRIDLSSATNASDPPVHSLAGLQPNTARQFVTTIQPILFNRCGNARCHGPSVANTFQLDRFRVGSGTHRLKSERNLATILEHVDSTDPGASALLKVAHGSHAGVSVFHGPVAARQIKLLTTWVHAAIAELFPNAARNRSRPSPFQPQLPLIAQARTADVREQTPIPVSELPESEFRGGQPGTLAGLESVTVQTRNTTDQPPSDGTRQGRQPKLRGFQDVLRQTENASAEPDAFDPDEFNRKYAGRGSAGN